MPISLWKDHSAEAGAAVDLHSLKAKYVADGLEVAQRLRRDSSVLAVWLSGPFERTRLSPTSDLHIAVLIEGGGDRYYRHQLPPFSDQGRRLEIAFLPQAYLNSIMEKGYSRWTEVFDLHKLSEVEVLYEQERILSEMRARMTAVRPTRLFVGKQIEALSERFQIIDQLLRSRRYEDAIMTARMIWMDSLSLSLLVAGDRVSSKLSQLCREFDSRSSPSQSEAFTMVQASAEPDEQVAAKRVRQTRNLIRDLFERQGVCIAASS